MNITHVVFHGGPGYGWHVRDLRRGTFSDSVAGPYTSRESAQAKADELSAAAAGHDGALDTIAAAAAAEQLQALALRGDLATYAESQAQLNTAVARALEAFSLMHDRYDAELGEIRSRLAALEGAAVVVAGRLDQLNRLHSVKS